MGEARPLCLDTLLANKKADLKRSDVNQLFECKIEKDEATFLSQSAPVLFKFDPLALRQMQEIFAAIKG